MTGEGQTEVILETTLQPGQLVGGKYRVDRLIGKGGMAEVWAGTNERTGKRIALKAILRSFASSSDAIELFRREALASSRVNHPNVVNVFDVIDHEGMTCIVMEMLEGEPFGTYLKRKGYLGVDEAVALLLPAMRGVAAANAEGVVHRDLKPQNIFICIDPDGRLITTKVLDFGISVIREKSVDSAQVTQLLATHGTPAYMSPEHISGAPDIDGRADVYGFGVLFFEALTGQLPFLGDPGPALLVRILNEPAPQITLFRPDLPARMVEIVHRAMAKDAKDRFATLNDFVRAVEDHMLPPSTLPRSLTPMAGVPMFTMSEQRSEQRSGVADSVVQVPRRSEPSGLHEINETKALFTLPRQTSRDTGGSLGDPSPGHGHVDEVQALTTTQVNLRPSFRRSTRRFWAKRWVPGALFAAVVMAVVWFAVPSPPHHRSGTESPPASRSARPAPVAPAPAPVVETPAPIPTPAAVGQEAGQNHEGEVAPAPQPALPTPAIQMVNSKQNSIHSMASLKTAPARASAAQAAEHRASKPAVSVSHTSTHTGTRTQSSAPRAGALTPDDF
jgi:serine/threonine-protein kinase